MTNAIQILLSDVSFDHYGEHSITALLRNKPEMVKGCPMGRGMTPEAALADLDRRIRLESHVRISWIDG